MVELDKIQDIQIEEKEAAIEGKNKIDFYIELVLFLILGVLVGIALKTEAVKRITVGFDDYKMKFFSQSYDLNKMQDEQIKKMEEQAQKESDKAYQEESESQENN